MEGNYVADHVQMPATVERGQWHKKAEKPQNYMNNQPLAAFLIGNKSFYDLLHGMSGRPPLRVQRTFSALNNNYHKNKAQPIAVPIADFIILIL